jgi:hypothetical protein
VEGRIYPFAGSFFLGVAFGRQRVSIALQGVGQPTTLDLSTRYVAPRLGWLATWSSGFSLGLDLGVQTAQRTDFKAGGPQLSSALLDTARQYAGTPLPTLNLRLGWML